MTYRRLWLVALAISIVPVVLALLKFILVNALDLNLTIGWIEFLINLWFYSIAVCFALWLALTIFSFVRKDWKQGAMASAGALPLLLLYACVTLAVDR